MNQPGCFTASILPRRSTIMQFPWGQMLKIVLGLDTGQVSELAEEEEGEKEANGLLLKEREVEEEKGRGGAGDKERTVEAQEAVRRRR